MSQFYKFKFILKKLTIFLLLMVFLVTIFTSNALAVGRFFPTTLPNNPAANLTWYNEPNRTPSPRGYVIVTKSGNGVTLNTPNSKIRVFYKLADLEQWSEENKRKGGNGNPVVTINWVGDCTLTNQVGDHSSTYQLQTIAGVSGDVINWQNYGSEYSNYGCTGNEIKMPIDINAVRASKAVSYYSNEWGVIQVDANKTGGSGIVNFAVSTDEGTGGFVSFAEQNRNAATDPYNQEAGAFSLWNGARESGNLSSQFNLNIKPDCGYATGTRDTAILKWTDADQGEPNQVGDISFKLFRKRQGETTETKIIEQQALRRYTLRDGWKQFGDLYSIGGQDAYRSAEIRDIKPGDSYRWEWNNVSRLNGIQFWLPFSEANNVIQCPPAEQQDTVSTQTTVDNHEKGTGNKIVKHIIYVKNGVNAVPGKTVSFNIRGIKDNGSVYDESVSGTTDASGKVEVTRTINSGFLDNQNLPYSVIYTTLAAGAGDTQATLNVYEVPFSRFRDNDVKACANPSSNRFLFNPTKTVEYGSYTNYASVWRDDYGTEDYAKGYSNGMANFTVSLNKLRSHGINTCADEVSISSPDSEETGLTYQNFEGRKGPIKAKTVYINHDITSSYDYSTNSQFSNPPILNIEAENVYISSNVKNVYGVNIKANNIYTCAYKDGENYKAVPKTDWHKVPNDSDPKGCKNYLRIEGAVSTKNLYLMRSVGTRYKSDNNVGTTDNPSDTRYLTQQAELVFYPAYFYFTNVGSSAGGSAPGKIQSYSQAPPRL